MFMRGSTLRTAVVRSLNDVPTIFPSWRSAATVHSVSGRTTLSYKFDLTGKTSYKIARTAVRTQSIHAENYIRIVFQRLVTNLTVRLQGPALTQLDVKLLSVGTALDFKDELHLSAAGIRQMVHELLICPRQGFMLVMTRLPPNEQLDTPPA